MFSYLARANSTQHAELTLTPTLANRVSVVTGYHSSVKAR